MNLGIYYFILLVFLSNGFGDVSGNGGAAVQDATNLKNKPIDETVIKPAVPPMKPAHEVNKATAPEVAEPKVKVIADTVTKGSTTTPKVTTTEPVTTPATTVAPKPTPVPIKKGDWTLRYPNSTICARIAGELTLKINYINESKAQHEVEISIPKDAKISGNCSTETMILTWPAEVNKNETKNNDVHFVFGLQNSGKNWQLANITGVVFLPIILNSTTKVIGTTFNSSSTSFFNEPVGTSYLCAKSVSYDIHVNSANTNSSKAANFTSGALVFSQLQVEAYKPLSANNDLFGSPINCEMTPDMVPIVVGLALAGLVVIVLIAYLIAQRKPPAQGYRSV